MKLSNWFYDTKKIVFWSQMHSLYTKIQCTETSLLTFHPPRRKTWRTHAQRNTLAVGTWMSANNSSYTCLLEPANNVVTSHSSRSTVHVWGGIVRYEPKFSFINRHASTFMKQYNAVNYSGIHLAAPTSLFRCGKVVFVWGSYYQTIFTYLGCLYKQSVNVSEQKM